MPINRLNKTRDSYKCTFCGYLTTEKGCPNCGHKEDKSRAELSTDKLIFKLLNAKS